MTEETTGQSEQTILIVDDNPVDVQLLTGMLEKSGFKARAALTGQVALQAAEGTPPDLILLDIDMEEMKGYEVCERLKADERLRSIPVIFISALNETIDKVRAFRAGGVDYVTKPFQFEEVEARVKTHLDLQARKKELERSYQQLRDAERLRDNLVHMLAHDLRNSLTAISGYLDLIAMIGRNTLSEKGLSYVKKGSQSVAGTASMISTMLDVSRMEAGTMKLHLMKCDILAIAQSVISEMESLKGEGEMLLDAPDVDAYAAVDRDVIRRVIQNLVGNGLKNIPPGGWVRVGVRQEDDRIRVTVRDNGSGIRPEDCEKIFDKFGQADPNSTRTTYSSGLGLTFCKLAVETHRGRIGVDSDGDRGNTFWFDLPVEAEPG